jgi:hypothetical protein
MVGSSADSWWPSLPTGHIDRDVTLSSQLELINFVIIWFWGRGLVIRILPIRYEIWKGKCCL